MPRELERLESRLPGLPAGLPEVFGPLSSIIKRNLSYQPENQEPPNANGQSTERTQSVSSSQVTGAYRRRYRTPAHVPSFDDLTPQNQRYALECIEIFKGAYANKTDPRSIDYEGRERWMFDTYSERSGAHDRIE